MTPQVSEPNYCPTYLAALCPEPSPQSLWLPGTQATPGWAPAPCLPAPATGRGPRKQGSPATAGPQGPVPLPLHPHPMPPGVIVQAGWLTSFKFICKEYLKIHKQSVPCLLGWSTLGQPLWLPGLFSETETCPLNPHLLTWLSSGHH